MVIQVTEFAPLRFKANLGKDDAPFIITLHESHDLYLCLLLLLWVAFTLQVI
jgi:hypothetical protein